MDTMNLQLKMIKNNVYNALPYAYYAIENNNVSHVSTLAEMDHHVNVNRGISK